MDLAVAFVAHPDDETYPMAGTLMWLVDRGFRVRVVCLTRGEGFAFRHDGDVARTRVAELEASCAVIGAEAVALDLPDGDVAGHPVDLSPHAAGARLVLTMGPDGAYGHPDHVACTRLVDAARFDGTLWHTAFAPGLFAPVHRALGRHVALAVPLDALGTERADHTVDVRPYAERKVAAVACHDSQLRRAGEPRSFLVEGFLDRTLAEERWVHVRGPELAP